MQSKAKTVAEYLASLPADRRTELETVRRVVLANLASGFEEGMQYGMIGWFVPHRLFPAGYHCDPAQPLPMGGLAAQKNAFSLYLMPLYGDTKLLAWFTSAWQKTGKKLDMGKACIRFKKAEDLALDVVAATLQKLSLRGYVDAYVAARSGAASAKRSAKTAKQPVAKARAKAKAKPAPKAAKKPSARP